MISRNLTHTILIDAALIPGLADCREKVYLAARYDLDHDDGAIYVTRLRVLVNESWIDLDWRDEQFIDDLCMDIHEAQEEAANRPAMWIELEDDLYPRDVS